MAITRGQLDLIAKRRERAVYNAFVQVIQSIRDQAVIQEITRALEVGNVERVLDLLQLDQATYEPLENEILQSFRQGGLTGADQVGKIPMREGELVARFNIRAPAAEAWAAAMSSRLVVEIVDTQRDMLRETIRRGLADGRNPRSVALDIVGRLPKGAKHRSGGFIGLTWNQADWIYNARRELEELDPAYFERKLRDKRFDRTIAKAIREEKPIPRDVIDNAIYRMQGKAERYRGEVIARTESISALREGQQQAIQQAFETSDVLEKEVEREWSDTGDGRTRKTHRDADKKKVKGWSEPFIVGGYRLMYPGDSSLGAPARETIQCRCRVIERIKWGARAARIEGFG